MKPIGHDATGAHIELEIELRQQRGVAAAVPGNRQLPRGAAVVPKTLHLRFQPRIEGNVEIPEIAEQIGCALADIPEGGISGRRGEQATAHGVCPALLQSDLSLLDGRLAQPAGNEDGVCRCSPGLPLRGWSQWGWSRWG